MAVMVNESLSQFVRAGNIAALEEIPLSDLQNNIMSSQKDTALHLAAMEGQFDSFKVICTRCPSLFYRLDGNGYTPLHVAVNSRQYEIVKMLTTTELLDKEQEMESEVKSVRVPNQRLLRMLSRRGETALLRAVYLEYIEMVALLTEADPDFQHPGDWSKQTPLEQALTQGSANILYQLLKACPASAFGGMTTLAKGARRVLKRETVEYFKRVDCLKVIYRRYPSLAYYRYKWGETTLHKAARRGETEIIRYLIYASSKPPYLEEEDTDNRKEEEENPDEKLLRMVNKDQDTVLHLAVKEKHHDVVKLIIETTPGKKLLLMTNEDMDTPLLLAVRNDHLEMSKLLIRAYSHEELVKMVDKNKNTCLHLAIETQNLELVKLLTKGDLANELVTMGNKNRNTALHLAVKKGDIELVAYFLTKTNSDKKLLTAANEDMVTALHLAVSNDLFQVVNLLITADTNQELITMVDKDKNTALHLAVQSQNIELVKFLSRGDLSKELVRMGDKNKNTALHLAVKKHHLGIAKILLTDSDYNRKLVRMVNEDMETALHLAVRAQLLEVVKFLVEVDPDKEFLGMVNKKKNTALHLAIEYQFIDVVKVLTEADDDKDLVMLSDMNNNTALHLAVKQNDLEVVEYFLTKASLDTKMLRMVTMDRNSALHLAVHNHSLELVKLLIGADPRTELVRMVDKNKNTALHLAVEYQHLEMVKVLTAADTADNLLVRMGDKNKNTALHLAVKSNNLEIVECLTNIADPNNKLVRMVNKDKNTALHLAVQNSLLDVVKLLTTADPEYEYEPNNAGVTPLYMAVDNGLYDIVDQILGACPSSAYGGPKGETALRAALVRGNSDIRKLLLEKQPDQCKVVDERGWTSLHFATFNGDTNAVKDILRSCPSCSREVDNDGRNFLHVAAINKHVDVVKHALESNIITNGVLNRQDNYGYTPLHIAAETGNQHLVLPFLQSRRVNKMTENAKGDKVLDAITFDYDKEKVGVHGVRDRMNEKELKEQRDFDLVVCALIATISFTAGITVPGGYINDGPNRGTAVLSHNKFFDAFLISNAFSLVFSLAAAFSHFCTRRLLKKKDIIFHVTLATFCTLGAIFATMVSFVVGSFAVLTPSNGIAIAVCVICSSFFIFAFYAMWRMAMQYRQPAR